MFIKLTNMVPERKGDPLYLNVNHIKVVDEDHVPGGSLLTQVHAENVTWSVEESLGEVMKLIGEAV
jgi:murein L,D-transpeptidase YcbB/YkuD